MNIHLTIHRNSIMNKRIHHPLLWIMSALLLTSCASTKSKLSSSNHPEGWATSLKETSVGEGGPIDFRHVTVKGATE